MMGHVHGEHVELYDYIAYLRKGTDPEHEDPPRPTTAYYSRVGSPFGLQGAERVLGFCKMFRS